MYMFQSVIEDIMRLLPSYRKKKEKQNLRAILMQKRRILTKEETAAASAEVVEQIACNPLFAEAQNVMIYYPVNNEIDLRPLYSTHPHKTFLMPVTHRNSIEVRQYTGEGNVKRGKFGIPEPQTATFNGKVDLIFVPGVGFDISNHRLGRGGGYYDRFLSSIRRAKKIGVCYKFQLVEQIPHDRHVQQMDMVIAAKTK